MHFMLQFRMYLNRFSKMQIPPSRHFVCFVHSGMYLLYLEQCLEYSDQWVFVEYYIHTYAYIYVCVYIYVCAYIYSLSDKIRDQLQDAIPSTLKPMIWRCLVRSIFNKHSLWFSSWRYFERHHKVSLLNEVGCCQAPSRGVQRC